MYNMIMFWVVDAGFSLSESRCFKEQSIRIRSLSMTDSFKNVTGEFERYCPFSDS